MNGLKFKFYIYALYVKKDKFILYFETMETARAFATKYYSNVECHIEPYCVHTFEEKKNVS